jgi:hypothetical protein
MLTRRDLWPLFRLSLGISLLAHLLFVVFVPLVPREQQPPPRLQVRLVPLYRQLEPLLPGQTESRPLPGELPEALLFPSAPGTGGAYGFVEGSLGTAPLSSSAGSGITEALPMPQPKPLEFEPEQVELPDLDSLALQGLKKAVEDREHPARLHLPDSDTTDAESQRRRQARQVVERAIQAMGGWEALRAIHEMRARVWIEATEHVIYPTRLDSVIVTVLPYAYPMATWQYQGQEMFVNTPIKVRISLDLAEPNEAYVLRNPTITRSRYHAQFDARWSALPLRSRRLREQGEATRWHFLERFFGEGIILEYLGIEDFHDTLVDVIHVEDTRYGYEYQALFSRRTGLLQATREGLITTVYDRYRTEQGVLVAHRLERYKLQRGAVLKRVVVHLMIAYNGQEPDRALPALEE